MQWRVLQSKDFTDVIVRESKEVQSKLLKNMTPGQVVTQRGASQRLASGLVRMPIEPEGWVTVHARYIGGPTFMEEFRDDAQGPSAVPGFASRPAAPAKASGAAAPNPTAVPRSGLLGAADSRSPGPQRDRRQDDQDVWAGARAAAPGGRTSPPHQRPKVEAPYNPPSTGVSYVREDLLRLQQRLLKKGHLDEPLAAEEGGKLRMLHIPTMDAGRSDRRHRGDRKDRGDRGGADDEDGKPAGTSPPRERGDRDRGHRDDRGPGDRHSPPRERRGYEDDRSLGPNAGGGFLRGGPPGGGAARDDRQGGPLAGAPAPAAAAAPAATATPAPEAGGEDKKKGQCPTQ